MYKVYVNQDGRYLVKIYRNGDIDTTKVLKDARLWLASSNTRMGNLRVFNKRNKELLDAKGFTIKEVTLNEIQRDRI